MLQLYRRAKAYGQRIYHRDYCLYNDNSTIAYDSGAIRCISLRVPADADITEVTVYFAGGDVCR